MDKNKKRMLMIGLAVLLLLIVWDKQKQTMAMTTDDLNSKGYNLCGGKDWTCCEKNTYYMKDQGIMAPIKSTFTGINYPSTCCPGYTSTTTTITVDNNWYNRVGNWALEFGGASVASAACIALTNVGSPVCIGTVLLVTVGWDNIWNVVKGMFATHRDVPAYVCEDIPDIPGTGWVASTFGVTGSSAIFILLGGALLLLLLIIR